MGMTMRHSHTHTHWLLKKKKKINELGQRAKHLKLALAVTWLRSVLFLKGKP